MKKGVVVAIITGIFLVISTVVSGLFVYNKRSDPVVKQEFYLSQNASQDGKIPSPQNNGDSSPSNSKEKNEATYLGDLYVFNVQCNWYGWHEASLKKWQPTKDFAADNKQYPHAFLLGNSTTFSDLKVEYLLDGQYTSFSTGFLLNQESKSTTAKATWKVLGDGEELYVSPEITGGFVPQQSGKIDLTGVTKMTIYLEIDQNVSSSFGIVLTDPVLA